MASPTEPRTDDHRPTGTVNAAKDDNDSQTPKGNSLKSLTDMAGNLDTSTAQVLTALRIVATRAGVIDLARWAAKEMEGYEDDDQLPAHRIWKLSIVGSLHNPMQGVMKNTHLGDFAIAKTVRDKVTTFHCRESVGDIERMLNDNKDGTFGGEQPNLAMLVNTGPMANEAWTCVHAEARFPRGNLQTVVTKARQTALQLCLECEEQGVELQWGGDDDTSHDERIRWLATLRDEGTKVAIRAVWEGIKLGIMNG